MAQITPTDEATLNRVYRGGPYVEVPAKSSIVTATMNRVYRGGPFVRNDFTSIIPPAVSELLTNIQKTSRLVIKKINGIIYSTIKNINKTRAN